MAVKTAVGLATLAWAELTILTKRRYDLLIGKFGSLEKAWEELTPRLLHELGCKEQTVPVVLEKTKELDVENIARELEEKSIRFLTIDDEAYPESLRNIGDPPVFLFAKGNLDALQHPSIAIVGTRKMSGYGKRVVQALVPDLVRSGTVIVSGLAVGIDAQAAIETMEVGGKTIAVLGHGLHAIYPPRNRELSERILETGGLLLSEYPLGVRPDKYTFPARNRIIAGMTIGTIVAEASEKSGSLITASLALEYGREVFAVPGQIFDPNFRGTHELIGKGCAKLIADAKGVLQELGFVTEEKEETSYRPQTPEEEVLLRYIHSMPQTVDDLVEKTGLPVGTVNATLTLMELKGGAKNVGAGQWISG